MIRRKVQLMNSLPVTNPKMIESFQIPTEYRGDGSRSFGEGAYSFVFFVDGVATKIFRRDKGMDEDHLRNVFNSEVAAYQKAQASSLLQNITPKFYGPIRFGKILDNEYGYPSAKILIPDCAYQMEYLRAPFIKLEFHPSCKEITKQFTDAGIHYVKDASVTDPESSKEICVIDFAIEEHIPSW